MEIDLLFTVIRRSDWKITTEDGQYEPTSYKEEGIVQCLTGDSLEAFLNKNFNEVENVMLVVIDPLRIEAPIKKMEKDGFHFVTIQGTFSLDAIIDKIPLEKDKEGKYSIKVKHYD